VIVSGKQPKTTVRDSAGVQLGDHNVMHNHFPAAPRVDHAARGRVALRAKDYGAAVSQFTAALEEQPEHAELRYLLALALLGGRRPHQVRSRAEVTAIRQHLAAAETLDHARLLRVLVEEDLGRHWERGAGVPSGLVDLVRSVPPERAAELVEHISAPRNRVWELLIRQVN
jgi:hypothetical protein